MSRQTIIDTAAAEKGTKESPPNSNLTKYGLWYGLNGRPWCAIFVSWVYDKSDYPLGKIDSPKGYHYCPSAYNFWKAHNRLTNTPQLGDIVLFDWDGDGSCDHTGIFIQWIQPGKTFTSWEGNTGLGNDSDGGEVMMRTRNAAVVKAFVNPGVIKDVIDVTQPELKKGDVSAGVTQIQKILYDLHYTIVVDGQFGPATERVVKQFQREHGIEANGIVNGITEGGLEAALNKPNVPDKKLVTGSFLKKGDAGAAVVALQKALNKKRVKPALGIDGVLGVATVTAVKSFQKSRRLGVDGIAGPETCKALGLK